MNSTGSILPRLAGFDESVAAPRGGSAPTKETASGVRHWGTGSLPEIAQRGDVYEIPCGVDGVPARITEVPPRWWGGGGKLEAVDASGHTLDIKSYPDTLVVVDAATGTTTTLSRGSLEVTVSAERVSMTTPMEHGKHVSTRCLLQEVLDPDGSVHVLTNYTCESEHIQYSLVRDAPPNQWAETSRDEKWEETVISEAAGVTTKLMARRRHQDAEEKGSIPSRVDQSGELTITGADGREDTYRLYVPPHSIAHPGA